MNGLHRRGGPSLLASAALLTLAACGGSGTSNTPTPAAVASVEVSPGTVSLLTGATAPLSATTKDAQGQVLAGRTVTWSTSNAAVATVSSTGVVTAVAPGDATISATSEGKSGTASVAAIDPTRIPSFVRPFPATADFQTTNFFDHDIPKEFVDSNGKYVAFWGEDSLPGIDGHNGYDWRMPTGTPVFAAMAGTVQFAGVVPAFDCPILSTTVSDQTAVRIDHTLPGGVGVRSAYLHLDTILVTAGQQVTQGQQIGTVGAKGCALNSHLHFMAIRLTQLNGAGPAPIDPYGWSGPAADPWQSSSEGAQSIALWKAGEAPALFRRFDVPLNANTGETQFVGITQVRFQGERDDIAPNNEYVEVTRDNRFAPATLDLTGFTIKNKAGLTFTFPAGFTLVPTRTSVRVFSGTGTNTATELYWGNTAGVVDNRADCVQLFNSVGTLRTKVGWGGGCL